MIDKRELTKPDLYIERARNAREIFEWLEVIVVREALVDNRYEVVLENHLYQFVITFYKFLSSGNPSEMFEIRIAIDNEDKWEYYIHVYNWALTDKLDKHYLDYKTYVNKIEDIYEVLRIMWDVKK